MPSSRPGSSPGSARACGPTPGNARGAEGARPRHRGEARQGQAGRHLPAGVEPLFRRLIAEQLKGPDALAARKAVLEGNRRKRTRSRSWCASTPRTPRRAAIHGARRACC